VAPGYPHPLCKVRGHLNFSVAGCDHQPPHPAPRSPDASGLRINLYRLGPSISSGKHRPAGEYRFDEKIPRRNGGMSRRGLHDEKGAASYVEMHALSLIPAFVKIYGAKKALNPLRCRSLDRRATRYAGPPLAAAGAAVADRHQPRQKAERGRDSTSRGTSREEDRRFSRPGTECDKLADDAQDPEAKRMLHEAAKNWRIMAEHAEHLRW
jgi:hypothetical protein